MSYGGVMQLKSLVIILTMIFLGSILLGPRCGSQYSIVSDKISSVECSESTILCDVLISSNCNHTNSPSNSNHAIHCHHGHCCIIIYRGSCLQTRYSDINSFIYIPIKMSDFISNLFRPPIA